MKRLCAGLLVLAACQTPSTPPPTSGPGANWWESDFLRISYFRFDEVPDPENEKAWAYQPNAWVLYSKSWKALRGETRTETYFDAFPRFGGTKFTDPKRISVATGELFDAEMRDVVQKIIKVGLLKLPPMSKEPGTDYLQRVHKSKDSLMVRVIRVESERGSIGLLFTEMPQDRSNPTTRMFLDVETNIVLLMTNSTRMIRVGVSPRDER